MNVQALLGLRTQLEDRDSARNNSYKKNVTFVAGTDYSTARKQGYQPGVSAALSSVFAPPDSDEDAELRTPINVIKPAVENKIAFLGLQPTVQVVEPPSDKAPGASAPGAGAASPAGAGAVPPPGPPAPLPEETPLGQIAPQAAALTAVTPDEDWAITFADREEKVLRSLLDFSNLPRRCRDIAWSQTVMDGAVLGVWPDFKHERPRFFTRTPENFYPVSYDPDGLELTKAVWTEELNGYEIEARWGNKKYVGRDDVMVTYAIDEENFYTLLDDKEWAHAPVENVVGFVPIVLIPSLGLPNMLFGGSSIVDAIPIAQEINYHMSLIDEMASALTRPTIAVKDPLNVPDNIAIGTGGVIEMGPQGKVDLLGPLSLPNSFWQLGAVLQNWLDVVLDNPSVLRGESGSSIITGKGFNSQLGPIAARMQTMLELNMAAWRQACKYALKMWANFPGVSSPLKLSGSKTQGGGQLYYIEAKPEEFMVDGEIWTELVCFLNAQSYLDRQGSMVEMMQLVQNELISRDTAMDNIPYVVNRKRENEKIDRDRKWRAEGMAIAQQAANSLMTANPDIGAQERTNYGLERGFMGEMPGMPGPVAQMPPGPGGPAPGGPPGEMMEPEEDLVEVMREFFAGIGKLKGAVWFGGDPVLAPEKFASDDWKVTVWVTDPQDKGTITRAAEKVPEVYGHIQFREGPPGPEEQAVQVAGGPQVAPEEAMMEEVPEEAPPLPEELAGMMGGM